MITQLLMAILIGFGFVGFASAVIYSSLQLKEELPDENRMHLDPLPRHLRILWPVVRFVDYYVCQLLPRRLVQGPTEALRLSGLLYLMNGSQFLALSLISAAIFAAVGGAKLSLIHQAKFPYILCLAFLGYWYPRVWLSDALKKRRKEIVRSLPIYLDFLTMGIEAGLNMNGAMSQAVDKGPAGPLKSEFSMVLRDLRAGLTRSDALRRMDERTRVPQVSSFVSAVIQAERIGASLGPTFRHQAEQRRTERFQLAEKMAMEAPVKLIFPLVAFIFPATFVVLLFPIAIKLLQTFGVIL